MKTWTWIGAISIVLLASAAARQPGRAAEKCGLTYENFGKAFMQAYCAQCHDSQKTNVFWRMGAPKGFDFDQPEGVKKHKDEIIRFAVTKNDMPPPWMSKPNKAERAQLAQWLDCEYPE